MSYDLFLYPQVFDAEAIRAHFAERRWYAVSGAEIFYANEDTGVYFSFALTDSSPEGDGEASPAGVAFNLNFYRPHVFALEAEPEVAAFVERFPSRIEDPQTHGMGAGPYSRAAFLSGWNAGNNFAFQAIGSQNTNELASADPATIERVWTWNHGRARLQQEAGDGLFVPKVVWVQPEPGASPITAVTWTSGVATLIPETLIKHIVLVRQQRPALMKMFSGSAEPKFEFKLLNTHHGIRLKGLERGKVDGQPALFTPIKQPPEVQALFAGNWEKPKLKILPVESVAGSDLVALAKKPSASRGRS